MRDIKRIDRILDKIKKRNNPDDGLEQHLDRILKEPKVKQSYLKKLK